MGGCGYIGMADRWEYGASECDFNGGRVGEMYPKEELQGMHRRILYMN